MRNSSTRDQLVQYNGSRARFDVGRESYGLYREDPKAIELKSTAQKVERGTFNLATRAHIPDLLECVKSRKDLNAPVEAGHATSEVIAARRADALE